MPCLYMHMCSLYMWRSENNHSCLEKSNSVHEAWWQVPLPPEPSHQLVLRHCRAIHSRPFRASYDLKFMHVIHWVFMTSQEVLQPSKMHDVHSIRWLMADEICWSIIHRERDCKLIDFAKDLRWEVVRFVLFTFIFYCVFSLIIGLLK